MCTGFTYHVSDAYPGCRHDRGTQAFIIYGIGVIADFMMCAYGATAQYDRIPAAGAR